MKPIPANAQIQKLITSHPDGVKGPPLAVAWSTHHPGTLIIIDTVGHKLIFENASPLPAGEGQGEGATPNDHSSPDAAGETPPAKPAKPVGARPASPASLASKSKSKSKSKPSPSGRGQGEGMGEGAGQGEAKP